MEKIKHIVATRFLCFDGNLGDKVTSKGMIDKGLRLMSSYLIPTLENQTNQNFELVILVHPKLNLGAYKRKLLALSDKLNIKVMRYGKLDEYVRESMKEAKCLIVSRIDYDDLIWRGAVEDTQAQIGKAPILIYGYNRGYAWKEGDRNLMAFYQEYKRRGHIGIFQSSIIDTANGVCIHPYRWNHTKPLETFERLGINKDNLVSFEQNRVIDAFIWVRYANSSSGLIFPAYVKQKAYLDKDEVERVFGAKIIE